MNDKELSRRQFLTRATLSVGGAALLVNDSFGIPAYIQKLGKPNSVFNGVQIGAITYSWRSMPGSAEDILRYCQECNLSAIELMGPTAESFAGAPEGPGYVRGPLTDQQKAERAEAAQKLAAWRTAVSMDKFVQLRKMYNKAGVSIYAYKPSALESRNTDAEVDYACRAAKALGASHVTVELPNDAAQSKRLGDIGAKNKIYIGYHGHTQQTPTAWDEAMAHSEYNAMNLDMGHYVAAGYDPLPLIKEKHQHIVSMHTKDRKSKANGGDNVVWGEGDTPIVQALQLIRDNKYKFPCSIELEYPIPAGSDAVKETARCVEYARKALMA